VFCTVVAGGDRDTIYRDEHVAAFLDHAPVIHGHTLVVTAKHYETLEDVPESDLAPLFSLVQRVSRALGSALGAEGSLTLSNTRISQSVPHVHIHVVPRRKGDSLFSPGRTFWMRQKYREGQAEEITAKLRAALAR
jgi:histidine triad (HIT) family protein